MPDNNGKHLLEVSNLSIAFGKATPDQAVVRRVSFTLKEGETLGIVGESGSGKTLSALALMGLLPQQANILEGSALLHSGEAEPRDLIRLEHREMRKLRGHDITMIFQEPMSSLNPVMRCGKQVIEVMRQHLQLTGKAARKRCIGLFREVQLPRPEGIYRSYPHQLSGGQKQRVMIAMAMACNPRLIIADEPTTALDVTVQKAILGLLKELARKHNTAIIFITHDLGVVRSIADNVLVMKNGEVVEQGPVQNVFNTPVHPYTQGLMACRPGLGHRPERLLTVQDFLAARESGKEVFVREIGSDERRQRLQTLYSQDPILKVSGLQTWFPSSLSLLGKVKSWVKAVDDVSLEVYPGETLGLVGESGSGKTTLGRSILRLQPMRGGRIVYLGRPLSQLEGKALRDERKGLQIIFQDPYSSLNPRISAGEAIMEPMKVHRLHGSDQERRQKALALMEKVGLEVRQFNRYPHEFSGGQRQRIGIARALALEPSFIVCDESVSALDVSVQAQVLNLLNALKKEFGLTYIFISHDLSVVRYMSDRIVVLRDGKVVESGDADELILNPKEDYTRALIEAIPH
jgi:peptide/nickel transport system ATP-binding protein